MRYSTASSPSTFKICSWIQPGTLCKQCECDMMHYLSVKGQDRVDGPQRETEWQERMNWGRTKTFNSPKTCILFKH
eukprot:m.17752 g.17752  ORF g.17752 m.17752 type:complete len:76 (-) comp7550_c0_seq2:389-616(-)